MTFVIWVGKDISKIKKDDLISLSEMKELFNGTHFE